MIKPQVDLELSIKALEVYQIEPAIIKNMLSNLNKLTEFIDEAKGICPHPFDEQETTFGGGVLCSKCNKLISKPEK